MKLTADQFGKALVASGLLTAEELKTIWTAIPAAERPRDGDAFAALLKQRGKLNDFQAEELLSGRNTPLALGDYVLLSKIGAGGMGQVFKAQHRVMERLVAIKLLPPGMTKDEAAIKRFQREVKAAARLSHPNIVAAYDAGAQRGSWYLVMEYVEGRDLAAVVKERGPLPIEQAANYVLQAARGLAVAHAEGIVHRDIKPANLLLDKKGTVKILDMGLARIESGDDGLTGTEQVMGTVDYMSPEQATDTKHADARADIYSLGCTLWFLLTGKKAYDGDTLIARLMAHREGPLPSLVKERDDAPWALEQVLHKMMAKRAADRTQTMDDVVAAIEPFAGGSLQGGMGSSIGMGSQQSAELAAFLQAVGPKSMTSVGAGASKTSVEPKRPAVALPEMTSAFVKPEAETDPKSEVLSSGVAKAAKSGTAAVRKKKPPMMLISGGVLGVASLVVAGIIIFIKNNDGEVVATVNAPTGVTAEITAPLVADTPPPAKPLSIARLLESPDYVWSAPENLGPAINGPGDETNPSLTGDQLRLFFRRYDSQEVYAYGEAVRASTSQPFGEAKLIPGSNFGEAYIARDGLSLVQVSALAAGVSQVELKSRTRPTLDAAWTHPISLGPAVNATAGGRHPTLSPDGLSLVFSRGNELWLSRRTKIGEPFGEPTPLHPSVNSASQEHVGLIVADDSTFVFRRNSVWFHTFTNQSGTKGALPLENVPFRDDLWLSPDGRTAYFSADLPGGLGGSDIWLTRRVPKSATGFLPDAPPTPSGPPVRYSPTGPAVDLLKHVDVAKGGAHQTGTQNWEWQEFGKVLRAETSNRTVTIPIDFNPPKAYVLEIQLTPVNEKARMPNYGIGLATGPQRFALIIDREDNAKQFDAGPWTGLQTVAGAPAMRNETSVKGTFIPGDTPSTIRIEVRPDGVTAEVNGKKLVEYRGDMARLTPAFPRRNEAEPDNATHQALWLQVHEKTDFTRLTLTPLKADAAPAGQSGNVASTGTAAEAPKQLLGHTDIIRGVATAPDNEHVYSISWDNTWRRWHLPTGTEVNRVAAHPNNANCLALSPDGKLLATGGSSFDVKLWDATSGILKRTYHIKDHASISALQFSPDSRSLLVGTGLGLIRLLDVDADAPLGDFVGHAGGINALLFLPGGAEFVSAGHDKTVRVWNAAAKKESARLPDPPTYPTALAVSPDENRLLVGRQGAIDYYELPQRKPAGSLKLPNTSVDTLLLLAEGRYLVTGSQDKTLRYWELATGKFAHEVLADRCVMSYAAATPDGGRIITGAGFKVVSKLERDGDYALHIWPVPTQLRPAGKPTIAPDAAPQKIVQDLDLLKLLDPKADAVEIPILIEKNDWSLVDGKLKYASDGKAGKLVAPVDLRFCRDYEFSFDVRRLSGADVFTLDFAPSPEQWSGIDFVIGGEVVLKAADGVRVPMGRWPAAAEDGGRVVVRFTRGPERGLHGTISVVVDGTELGRWQGDFTQLGGPKESHPNFPGTMNCGLFCFRDSFEIADFHLRVFRGNARLLRAGTAAEQRRAVEAVFAKRGKPRIIPAGTYGSKELAIADAAELPADFRITQASLANYTVDGKGEGNELSDADFIELAALPGMDTVDLVTLNWTKLTPRGIAALAELESLNYLVITGINENPEVWRAVAALPHLDTIDLQRPPAAIAGPCMQALAATPNLPAIGVTFGAAAATENAIKALGPAVNTSVTRYVFWSTELTDAAIDELTKLTHVHILGFDNSNLTDLQLAKLAKLPNLRELDVRKTKVTPAGVTSLKNERPDLLIRWDAPPAP